MTSHSAPEDAKLLSPAAPAVPQNAANRFAHIDALRAFAVGLVLLQHAGLNMVPGDAGVTVFFTISGFIITFILLRERDKTNGFGIKRFYVRRLLKLGPPFVIAILIPTLIYSLFRPVEWVTVAAQVFFSYNWIQVFANELSFGVLPGSNVVWSLAVEEQFYIVFAIVWLLLVRRSNWRSILTVVAIAAIVYSNVVRFVLADAGPPYEHLLRGTDARMDAIAWGVLAALAYHASLGGRVRWIRHLRVDWLVPVAVVAFLATFALQTPGWEMVLRNVVHPIATAAVILHGLQPTGGRIQGLFYRAASLRPVQFLGLASYSIYIGHYVVTEPLVATLEQGPLLLQVTTLLPLGILAGSLIYLLVERPVLAWRNRHGW